MTSRRVGAIMFLVVAGLGGCRVSKPPATVPSAQGAPQLAPILSTRDVPFRVINLTSNGNLLWICGSNESIAVSHDNGTHWEVKHVKTASERTLLEIDFASENFGYTTGTGGLLLTTTDGGETWIDHNFTDQTIAQASFSDENHGVVRAADSVLFTVDGELHWASVSEGQNAEIMHHFRHVFSVVALDDSRMGVMLKEGGAQYFSQAFLFTQDLGKSWIASSIPNVTLYSFLRREGLYWAVGTEVIHKDQPGGGYAVPVALYSSDGESWKHSNADLSACQLRMCTVCNTQGCLYANGGIARFFSGTTTLFEFPPNKELTTRWASTGSAFCFVHSGKVECTALKSAQTPNPSDFPVPPVVVP
ncbi:MAG TPA: YCF48-related protein [Terriglobales bacterium]|jgi:hypothetical protein|nr:YCF48-related protein [Terriglobales bacterium]